MLINADLLHVVNVVLRCGSEGGMDTSVFGRIWGNIIIGIAFVLSSDDLFVEEC